MTQTTNKTTLKICVLMVAQEVFFSECVIYQTTKLGDRDFGVAKSIVATRRSIVLIVKASNYRRNSGNMFQGEALTHVQYSSLEEELCVWKILRFISVYNTIQYLLTSVCMKKP